MPLPLLAVGLGALVGGGTVWKVGDASSKIVSAVLVAGVAYYAYKKAK